MRRLLAPPDDRRATHYQATTERRTTARRDHNTPDATNADNRSPTPLQLVEPIYCNNHRRDSCVFRPPGSLGRAHRGLRSQTCARARVARAARTAAEGNSETV